MKLYVLTAAAILSLTFLNSCKKEVPGYCTTNFFGNLGMTDVLGSATTTFGVGEDMVFNLPFSNTSGDSITVNYSDPWVVYEIRSASNDALVATTNPVLNSGGLITARLGNGQSIDGTYTFTANIPQGSYKLVARVYYEYMECSTGVQVEERTVDFSVIL